MLLVGATNRPQELDEAARRRMVKRLYIPLPDANARRQLVCNLLATQQHGLSAQVRDLPCALFGNESWRACPMSSGAWLSRCPS